VRWRKKNSRYRENYGMMKKGGENLEKDFDVVRILKNLQYLKAMKNIIFTKNQSTLLSNIPHILSASTPLKATTSSDTSTT
jgi:hypothetical protein